MALIWRWTGDNAFRDEMYGFSKSNMEYIFRELDDDGDGWPEGLGNVERSGMGEEKLDNTVYTIRGLYDLADMARSKGDVTDREMGAEESQRMKSEIRGDPGGSGRREPRSTPTPSRRPGQREKKIFQRHWIGVTPMEVGAVRIGNHSEPVPGLASPGARPGSRSTSASCLLHGQLRHVPHRHRSYRRRCHGDRAVLRHARVRGAGRTVIFTLNTAIMAVGEGNYGRLGEDQQQHYMYGNVDLQLDPPDEQPGAMPEIAPSPTTLRSTP